MKNHTTRYGSLLLSIGLCGLIVGCADNKEPTTQPSDIHDRQAQALEDPMGYKADTDRIDISGGDIGHYDPKAMRRDMDAVFNP
jgi:hypothetical protein